MRIKGLLLALLVTIAPASSGCYLSHERTAPAPTPDAGAASRDAGEPVPADPLDVFCTEVSTAICRVGTACCAPEDRFESCLAIALEDCATRLVGPAIRRSVQSGVIRFDPEAARAHVDSILRLGPTCDWFRTHAMPGTLRDLVTLRGAFTGTLEAGAPCSLPFALQRGWPSECDMGECGADARCHRFAGRGEPCIADDVCLDLDRPIVVDPTVYSGALYVASYHPFVPQQWNGSLLCIGGVCVDLLPLGAECDRGDVCASRSCLRGRCAEPGDLGTPCEQPPDCRSGYCVRAILSPGTCAAGDAPLGASCGEMYECATDACVGRCVMPICMEMAPYFWEE